jgi:hypothetical protein
MDEIFSVWYRSLTPDGRLWCESSDPEEVKSERHTSNVDEPLIFQKMEIRKVSEGWVPWE